MTPINAGSAGLPRVALFSLGGTIASTSDQGDSGGVSPTLGSADLLAGLGGSVHDGMAVTATSVRQLPSSDLVVEDLVELAARITAAFEAGAVGAVVTQGTSTIEETAFALELLVASDRPIVVTGAMRNPTLYGADGRANLSAALHVAASPLAAGVGAVVVFNDEIHAARFVRKSHTSIPSAFVSSMVGPIGYVTEHKVRVVTRPPRIAMAASAYRRAVGPVALVTMTIGDDGRIFDVLPSLGYAGVVIEGFGGGHLPARAVPAVQRLVEHVPVVLASRTGAGEILERTYSFAGGEIDLLRRGLLSAGYLDGLKARVLLSHCLASHDDDSAARDQFARTVDLLSGQ